MTKIPEFKKYIIPAAAVSVGLIIGLGIGYFQMQKEHKTAQSRIAEANKKVAYMQKKMADEKNETVASVEQRCQGDLENMRKEKDACAGQAASLKVQVKTMEAKGSEAAEWAAHAKKELSDLEGKYAAEIKQNKDLDASLKTLAVERQALQAELKRTSKDYGQCRSNNAKLSVISEELMNKYRNKGLGTVILQSEPLTQIKKVELEKITQSYRDEIEHLKLNNR